jgi:hypothetical protein
MHVHLRAGGRGDLTHAADVIWMTMRADDAGDVVEVVVDPLQVRAQRPYRAAVSRVDERDLVVEDDERVRADQPHSVQPLRDLHPVIVCPKFAGIG